MRFGRLARKRASDSLVTGPVGSCDFSASDNCSWMEGREGKSGGSAKQTAQTTHPSTTSAPPVPGPRRPRSPGPLHTCSASSRMLLSVRALVPGVAVESLSPSVCCGGAMCTWMWTSVSDSDSWDGTSYDSLS